jgi:hypothetical protein
MAGRMPTHQPARNMSRMPAMVLQYGAAILICAS